MTPLVNVHLLTVMLIDWEHYPPDTWAGECQEHVFLIKELPDGGFYYVFGTSDDVLHTGGWLDLRNAQAIANRWTWIVNNLTPDQQARVIAKL